MRQDPIDTFDVVCLICEKPAWRLVRDHDHITGKIRGLLCDLCNSYLGTVEWKHKAKPKARAWALKYATRIEQHLGRDTGIVYSERNRNETLPAAATIARLEHRVNSLEALLAAREK